VFYHGDVNRLSTDPQTRNYLQDNMGMSFIKPSVMRKAFLHALSQQEASGAMPDGILLAEGAELKYINQVPHTDHCVWLPVALKVYLDETGDYDILNEDVIGAESGVALTVSERVSSAMDWLLQARDKRGLSYIAQGDWCDPMNMVGYKGRGVSGWLTVATAYASTCGPRFAKPPAPVPRWPKARSTSAPARAPSTAPPTNTCGTATGSRAASPTTTWCSAPARTRKAASGSTRRPGPSSAAPPAPASAPRCWRRSSSCALRTACRCSRRPTAPCATTSAA
jgi:hypothetical protein